MRASHPTLFFSDEFLRTRRWLLRLEGRVESLSFSVERARALGEVGLCIVTMLNPAFIVDR